jgi:hypothetical protein
MYFMHKRKLFKKEYKDLITSLKEALLKSMAK